MRPRHLALFPALLLGSSLSAQSFGDGSAFGGSHIFSEGLNPLANPTRYDRAGAGFALGYEGGDLKAKGFADAGRDLNQGLLAADPALESRGLQGLHDRPFALRHTAYGFSWMEKGGLLLGYTREESLGVLIQPDLDPTHTGASIALNQTQALRRRTMTDRIILGAGGGGAADQPAYGVRLRLEHLRWGSADPASGPGFGPANDLLEGEISTTRRASVLNLDAGYEYPVAQSLRLGFTADHLIPHRYWGGVEAKPQFRAGVEFTLTPTTALRVESDLNAVQRLPLPVDQRSASASLRFDLGGTTLLQVGSDRRTAADQTWTTVGASLHFTFSGTRVGLGFQFGDDKPQRGAMVRFNG